MSIPAVLDHEGAQLTYTNHQAGVVVRLTRVGHAFRVSTEYATTGQLINELTRGGYATIADATPFARHLAEQFRAGKPVHEVIDAVMADLAATPVATPLAQLAEIGTKRQIAPTHAGAQLNPTSIPGWIALAIADRDGKVYRGGKGGQAQVKVLNALARKGYLVLTAKPGTRPTNWAYGEITPAGRIELERIRAQRATAAALHDALARLGVVAE